VYSIPNLVYDRFKYLLFGSVSCYTLFFLSNIKIYELTISKCYTYSNWE